MKRPKSQKPASEPRLAIEYWPIARLQPYVGNPRKNDKAVDRMAASIREYGFAVPVLARGSGEVIDGHLRLKGGAKLGMTEIPVIPCDGWSDAQVKAFRLMANRSVGWADWDVDLLAAEFAGLKELSFDLSLTGFDSREIDGFTLQANPAEDDVPPVPEAPVSRRGDLWLMGAHRLLCGDA
ncbi:MAG: ParB N-terminal domain-containing protein, partial [Candidatus Sulfotelmatobacter sp.]